MNSWSVRYCRKHNCGYLLGRQYCSLCLKEAHPKEEPLGVTTKPENPKTKLAKNKLPVNLLSPISMCHELIASNLGAHVKGYGEFNWRTTQVSITEYTNAMMRHLMLYMDGEDNDDESKGSHLSSILVCCKILLECMELGNLVDDRRKTGKVKDLMKRVEEILKEQKEAYGK